MEPLELRLNLSHVIPNPPKGHSAPAKGPHSDLKPVPQVLNSRAQLKRSTAGFCGRLRPRTER
eukprot:8672741-Alexandrium_andersonii.AAC.1